MKHSRKWHIAEDLTGWLGTPNYFAHSTPPPVSTCIVIIQVLRPVDLSSGSGVSGAAVGCWGTLYYTVTLYPYIFKLIYAYLLNA